MSTNIIEISKKYSTQAKCLKTLEEIRWGKVITCPYCDSEHIQMNGHITIEITEGIYSIII